RETIERKLALLQAEEPILEVHRRLKGVRGFDRANPMAPRKVPDDGAAEAFDAVVPDLAAWHKERLPTLPNEHILIAPDWICEVLSDSTRDHDRKTKMPLYAHSGVRWAWLVDPIASTLEAYVLGGDGAWGAPIMHRDNAVVRVAPFDAIELHLA